MGKELDSQCNMQERQIWFHRDRLLPWMVSADPNLSNFSSLHLDSVQWFWTLACESVLFGPDAKKAEPLRFEREGRRSIYCDLQTVRWLNHAELFGSCWARLGMATSMMQCLGSSRPGDLENFVKQLEMVKRFYFSIRQPCYWAFRPDLSNFCSRSQLIDFEWLRWSLMLVQQLPTGCHRNWRMHSSCVCPVLLCRLLNWTK